MHSANKINNYNRGGKRREKKSIKIYRTSQTIRIINVFLESLLSESFPSLGVTVHLTSPECPPTLCWSLDLLWGDSQILIWPYFCVFLPPMSTAIRTRAFSLEGALRVLYLFHRRRACLADRADLICSLDSWWEGFGSSSSATRPLGFSCGFISTSACGSSTGVCS